MRIEDRIFSPQRLALYGALLAAVLAAIFGSAFATGYWIFDPAGHPRFADFAWIWTAAQFALTPDAATAYDHTVFAAAQEPYWASTRDGFPYYHWIYPPPLFLIVAAIGLLPFGIAFGAWLAATAALYVFAITRIVPHRVTVLLALLPFPVAVNVLLGHTAFFVAGLLGLALAWLPQRPWLAGMCLGLLTYKPQFGLIFPVVLLVAGQWRVIFSACATFAVLVLTTTVLYGHGVWEGFWQSLRGSNIDSFMTDTDLHATAQTLFGLLQWFGVPTGVRWAIHGFIAALITTAVCVLWRRPVSDALKAAALAIGSPAVTPYLIS